MLSVIIAKSPVSRQNDDDTDWIRLAAQFILTQEYLSPLTSFPFCRPHHVYTLLRPPADTKVKNIHRRLLLGLYISSQCSFGQLLNAWEEIKACYVLYGWQKLPDALDITLAWCQYDYMTLRQIITNMHTWKIQWDYSRIWVNN